MLSTQVRSQKKTAKLVLHKLVLDLKRRIPSPSIDHKLALCAEYAKQMGWFEIADLVERREYKEPWWVD